MEPAIIMTTKRIKYIDALRGFTMILVVFGHVILTSLNLDRDSVVSSFFLSFRMPLFFFISGYIAYKKTELWSPSFLYKLFKKKAFVQLVPALIFFFIFYQSRHRDLEQLCEYVINTGFGGYWFTFVLFEMFCIYYLAAIIGKYTHNKITDITLIICCVFLLWFVHSKYKPQYGFLNLDNLFVYLKFFTFGILCKKYNHLFLKLIEKDYIKTFIITGFIVCFYHIYDSQYNTIYILNKNYLIRFTGLLTVFVFFHNKKDFFDKNNMPSRILQFIGRRTLDIYLLHYFFIPIIPEISSYLSKPNMLLIQMSIALFISILIIALCLLSSEIIRSSNYLARFCFGKDLSK